MKKITLLIIIVLLITVANAMFFNVYGKTIDEIKNDKSKEQEQLNKYSSDNDKLQKDKDAKSKDLTNKTTELSEIEKTVSDLNSKIESSEKEYDKKQKQFEKRLVSIVQVGDNFSYIELLLSSDTVFEFYEKVNLTSQVMKQDKILFLNLKTAKKELENNKDLKTKMLDIKSKEKKLAEDTLNGLNKDSETLAKEISESKSKIAQLASDESKMISESKSIESTLKSTTSSTSYTGGSMKWPVPQYTYLSSPYGYRGSEFHKGIDIAAPYGNSIVAANSGTVISSAYSDGYGNMVQIDHGGGIVTVYGHASSLIVSKGETVTAGQVIAKIGSTGQSTGNHCHFEVRVNGSTQNPLNYISEP